MDYRMAASAGLVALVLSMRGPDHAANPGIISVRAASLQDSLIATEKRSWAAWKARDPRFFEEHLSEDHLDIEPGGPLHKAQIVAGVASPGCVVASYAVDHFALTVFDSNTALLTYHAAQDTRCGGQPVPSPEWTSSLYLKRNGQWLNVLFQQTPARN